MNVRVFPLVVLITIGLSGCDKRREQTISVSITRSGAPIVTGDVRLHAERSCRGSYQANTLREGKASFSRTVEIGGLGVITDELSICFGTGDAWMSLFSSLHGPAPESIDIACDLDKPERQCDARFDGRMIDESPESEDAT